MFTSRPISRMPRHRTYFFKYMTMFFLGASAVMLATQAFDIGTSLNNSVQYIGKIILTNGGGVTGTGIVLDGSNGNAYFSGSVGIGTDTPQGLLDMVNGSAEIINQGSTGIATTQYIYGGITGLYLGFLNLMGNHLSFIESDGVNIQIGTNNNLNDGDGITITTGGDVGIGTDTPQTKLDVNGSGTFKHNILVNGSLEEDSSINIESIAGANPATSYLNLKGLGDIGSKQNINFYNDAVSANPYFSIAGSADDSWLDFNLSQAYYMTFSTHDTQRMKIDGDGNVGIGVGDPSERLEVTGTGKVKVGNSLKLYTDVTNFGYVESLNKLNFNTSGSIRMTINTSGYVGIGIASPTATLDVSGTVKMLSSMIVQIYTGNGGSGFMFFPQGVTTSALNTGLAGDSIWYTFCNGTGSFIIGGFTGSNMQTLDLNSMSFFLPSYDGGAVTLNLKAGESFLVYYNCPNGLIAFNQGYGKVSYPMVTQGGGQNPRDINIPSLYSGIMLLHGSQ